MTFDWLTKMVGMARRDQETSDIADFLTWQTAVTGDSQAEGQGGERVFPAAAELQPALFEAQLHMLENEQFQREIRHS